MQRWAGLVAAAVLLIVSGCGADDAAVEKAAAAFGAALGADDLLQACELLAPATRATLEYQQTQPCPQALRQDNLASGSVQRVEVWDGNAQA